MKGPKTLYDYLSAAGVETPQEEFREIALYCDPEKPDTPSPPMKHQITGLTKALATNRAALYDAPGVGKTTPSQAWLLYYIRSGNKAIAVMPPAVVPQYKESLLATFKGVDRLITLHVLNEGPAARVELTERWNREGWPDLLLMSYQMFLKMWQVLQAVGYCVGLFDEAHAFRNYSAQTSKAVFKFAGEEDKDASAILLMTGTPAYNTLLDTYGLIKIVTPDAYWSYRTFERAHAVKAVVDERKVLVGFKNLKQLNRNLYRQARRLTKEQVFTMQKPTVSIVPIELSPAHKALYRKLVKQRFLELDGKVIDATTAQSLRQKCLQIATVPELFVDKKPPKNNVMLELETLLESLGTESHEKVIVFMHYRASIDFAFDRLAKYNPARIYGGRTNNGKEKDKFLKDDTCRILLANPVSGGVGLNLQSVCRYVIFAEPTGVPGTFLQASERVHRKGQKKHVTIYIFKVMGTISPRAITNMRRKARDVVEVTGDAQSLLREFFDE